jgi:hypothetical protein
MAEITLKGFSAGFVYKFSTLKRLQLDAGKKLKDILNDVSELDPEAQMLIAYHGFKQASIDASEPASKCTPEIVEKWIDETPGLITECLKEFNKQYQAFYAIGDEAEKKPVAED